MWPQNVVLEGMLSLAGDGSLVLSGLWSTDTRKRDEDKYKFFATAAVLPDLVRLNPLALPQSVCFACACECHRRLPQACSALDGSTPTSWPCGPDFGCQVHPASQSLQPTVPQTVDYSSYFPTSKRAGAMALSNGCRVGALTTWRGWFNVIKEDITGGEVSDGDGDGKPAVPVDRTGEEQVPETYVLYTNTEATAAVGSGGGGGGGSVKGYGENRFGHFSLRGRHVHAAHACNLRCIRCYSVHFTA
jgi:hypothetical protein